VTGVISRITATLFIIIISFASLAGQDTQSLEKQLKESKLSDSQRIEVLNKLSLFLSLVNYERAKETADEAIDLSLKTNNKLGLANGYRNLSILYFYYDESYYISMEYLQQAVEIFESLNDSTGIANCYISLGHNYRSLLQRDKEIEYHKKAFDIFKRMGDIERIGVTALNTGESYLNNNELDKSRPLLEYAIRINDSINKFTTLTTCYKAMGILELKQQNFEKAKSDFLKAIEISEKMGVNFQKVSTIESMIELAAVYKIEGESDKQLDILEKAAEFSQKHELINYLRQIYTQLIQYYTEKDDHQAIIRYISEYQSVTDSISSRQIKDRANQINSIVQLHKLERESLIQEERLRIRNHILIVVLISVSILIWLLLKIFRKNKKITEVNEVLKNQQEIIENQRKHLEELNNTKDKFFSIVAHDLRSPLVSLRTFSDLLIDKNNDLSKEEISVMAGQLQENVDNTIKMADTLLTWARSQMKDLAVIPEQSFLVDVVKDINEFYYLIAEKKGIRYSCTIDRSVTVYGDSNQIAFVIRNLVNNAIKFTNSSGSVVLSAENVDDETVKISVADNGIGIPDELKKSLFFIGMKKSASGTAGEKGTGLGLILSYEFVRMNNGTIDIESKHGKGTTFILRFKRHA
jgi:signal transduction histidine kinase